MPADEPTRRTGFVSIDGKTHRVDFSQWSIRPSEEPKDFTDKQLASFTGRKTVTFEFTGFLRLCDPTERRAYLLRRPMGRA